MRLFVAFEMPAPVRDGLGRWAAEARRALPPARWVRREGFHLTLRFLGETDERALPALGAALAPAFASGPGLTARLAGAGCFPPGRRARVAWLGVAVADSAGADGLPHLLALRRRVEEAVRAALGAAGAAEEGRSFTPHVTVARPQPPWPQRIVESFVERWAAALTGDLAGPFPLAAGSLVESVLGSGGARYRTVESFPLGG